MDLKTCLYVGFALYTIFVIYVGFIGSKKIKGLSDFAVASESMGPISLDWLLPPLSLVLLLFWGMSDTLTPGGLPLYGYF